MEGFHLTERNAFREFARDVSNHATIEEFIEAMKFPCMGRRSYIPSYDRSVIAVGFELRGRRVLAQPLVSCPEHCRQYCRAEGKALVEANGVSTPLSERLLSAKCGRQFIFHNFINVKDNFGLGEVAKPTKVALHVESSKNPSLMSVCDFAFPSVPFTTNRSLA